jgi:hypothetical protein
VVHRDLKPSNVILSYFGPKVIDFGIARALDASTLPGGSVVIGTPTWMAPEQFANRPVTPAVDIFVWGALVAYAGTGRRPFGQGSIPELAWRVTYQQPDLEGLPGFLRELVARAMAKDPAARPSATALLLALVDDGAEDPGDAATQLLRRTWRPSGEQVPPAAPAPRPEPPPVAAAEAPAAPAPRAEPPPEPAPSPAAAPAGPAPRPEPPPVAGAGGRAVGRWLLGLVLLAVAAVGAALLLRGGLGGSGQAGRPTPAASTRPAGRAGGAPPAGGPAAAAPAFCRAVPVPGRQGELAELTAPVYYTAAGDAPAGWLADLDLLRGALAQAGMRQGCTRAWQDGAGRRLEVAVYDLVTIPRAVALRARFEQALAARGAARLPQPPPAGSRGFALPPAGSGELVLFRCKQLVAGLHLNATGPAATGQLDRWAHDVDVRLTAANHCGTA